MKFYIYDYMGFFEREVEADEPPTTSCTTEAPIAVPDGQEPRWVLGRWTASVREIQPELVYYYFDVYGWLTGHGGVTADRYTLEAPPTETEVMKANWNGVQWVLLDKAVYMATHFPQLLEPALVITSVTVDDAYKAHPDLELNFSDGEITVPAGAMIALNFEIQVLGKKVAVDKKWRVPLQTVDFTNTPNGNARFVFARVTQGVGVVSYQTKAGVSEKIIIDESVVNSGFKQGEPKLLFPAPLAVYAVEV